MVGILNRPSEQPEESPPQVPEYRRELEELRALVLYEQNQREIPLLSLDYIERGLSDIIAGLDRLLYATSINDILPSLKKAQKSVIKARRCLHIASDILEQSSEKPRSAHSSKTLYKNYEKFSNCLLEAIKHLNI